MILRNRRTAVPCRAVFFALAPSALAHDTYVDQGSGHDSGNNCSDSSNPCKTVLKGIAQAGTGHTIFINGGHTYGSSLKASSPLIKCP